MSYSSSVVGDAYLAVLLYSDLLSGRFRGPMAAECNRQVHHGEVIFSWLRDLNVVECTGSRGTYTAAFCAVWCGQL